VGMAGGVFRVGMIGWALRVGMNECGLFSGVGQRLGSG
jgi:hypothetical protein